MICHPAGQPFITNPPLCISEHEEVYSSTKHPRCALPSRSYAYALIDPLVLITEMYRRGFGLTTSQLYSILASPNLSSTSPPPPGFVGHHVSATSQHPTGEGPPRRRRLFCDDEYVTGRGREAGWEGGDERNGSGRGACYWRIISSLVSR